MYNVIKGDFKYKYNFFPVLFSSLVAASDLADQRKRLEDANKKKKSLEEDLQKAQDELSGIQRGNAGYVSLTQQFCSHHSSDA